MGNPILVNVANTAAYTPSEAAELVSRAGVKKRLYASRHGIPFRSLRRMFSELWGCRFAWCLHGTVVSGERT